MDNATIIDGIAGAETWDSSGELLDIKEADISTLEEGKGVLNWEHRGPDSHGHTPSDVVGKIIYAKKIFSADDCGDSRQLAFWKRLELPFIYIKARLFDAAGHQAAKDLAAIIRDAKMHNEPVIVGFSVEGATLDKEKQVLKSTLIKKVAVTVTPCNKAAVLDKYEEESKEEKEIKRIVEIAQADDLNKALEAGSTAAAPSSLTQGSALQAEEVDPEIKKVQFKEKLKSALIKWDKKQPLKEFLKQELKDVDPAFLDKFSELSEKMNIK